MRKVKSGETRLLLEWKLNALRKAKAKSHEGEEWRCSLWLNMATAEELYELREPLKYPWKITKKEGIVQLLGSFRRHDSCCHQNVTLKYNCVRISDLLLFHVGHVVRNWRNVLTLAWHEWFSCKGRGWKICCCGFVVENFVWQTASKNCTKKHAKHVACDYFSSFNQSYLWFVALSFLKIPHSKIWDDNTKGYIVYLVIRGDYTNLAAEWKESAHPKSCSKLKVTSFHALTFSFAKKEQFPLIANCNNDKIASPKIFKMKESGL